MIAALSRIVGPDDVLPGAPAPYGEDATGATLGLRGEADAVVRPATAEQVREVVAWCYEHDVPIVPRGGGTGFAGGAVPEGRGVVLSLERLRRVRALDPGAWRMQVEAGVRTETVARRARESGLFFPPNPGAAEQSLIGGNIATNAGGSRAFKYGVTRRWVTGLEVVVAPGELVTVGGPLRKDVGGYDLVGLMCGSEGTLGIVTAAWLALLPAPEERALLAGWYADRAAGCAAIEAVFACGAQPAAIEFADAGAIAAARAAAPSPIPADAGFLVLLEVDGSAAEVAATCAEAADALASDALAVEQLGGRAEIDALLRWRDGISLAVTGVTGAKVSDDVAVPVDRVEAALADAEEIGARHGLPVCSWGHAGDGNLHVSFLLPAGEEGGRERARAASRELHRAAVALGGAISGEHGIGLVKRGELERQLGPVGARLHATLKEALDPKRLFNPDKKR